MHVLSTSSTNLLGKYLPGDSRAFDTFDRRLSQGRGICLLPSSPASHAVVFRGGSKNDCVGGYGGGGGGGGGIAVID